MKIVFLCEFSSGICGVWNRVYNIAKILAKRHDVYVLSSNITKGTEKIAKSYEELDSIKIYRFPVYFRLGENALFWNYEKKLQEIKPDIINAHVYRHPHSTTILKIAKKLNAKCFLTTHAPFVEKELRNPLLNAAVSFYDKYFARKILNSYTKVIAITKWEIPFLIKLGCKRNKILYIPNGFPQEYLKTKIKYNKTKKKTIIFLGRIAPIKNLELLIEVFAELEKKHNLNLKLVGPIERGYEFPLLNLIKKLKLNGKIEFTGQVFNLNKKIKLLQESEIFVLPSKREASPLALIEAMSLGMIVLSSNTKGANEFLIDGKNGFIFNNKQELQEKIEYCIKNYKKLNNIRKKARESVKILNWKSIAKTEEKLYLNS